MEILRIVLIALEILASVSLIVVVMLQSGKESGLSGAISGSSETYLSKNGKAGMDKALAKVTKWIGLAWIVLTLALSLIPQA